jgi:hypothetical protein
MRLMFVDDSFPFDGYSPTSQPLGGPEKALANLVSCLAMRGHDVVVLNRCISPITAFGARWLPWEAERPQAADVLVAFRLPRLLATVPQVRRRILWTAAAPEELDPPAAQALLANHRPLIVFFTPIQAERWRNPLGLDRRVIEPGISAAYLEDDPMAPAHPPRAVSTSHPLGGLDRVLALWVTRIRPAIPAGELHVYSALLDKGRLGAEPAAAIKPVLDQALAARAHDVIIQRPLPDPQMAEAYRAARVHLYPGQPGEILATSLAESQAAGLPGVALASSPAVLRRIVDGQTGRIATAEPNFANAAIDLLGDRASFDRMSANARLLQRGRSWAVAAAEFEDLLA